MASVEVVPRSLIETLVANADRADAEAAWPAGSWEAACRAGVPRWGIPAAYGGDGLDGVELLARYRDLAAACLTTCFILSQRDAACRRLRGGNNAALAERLLPALARGERFATVGLSQLTTARQHIAPSLTARLEADALLLDGVIPWVTGAARADHLVVGAVLDDGRQVLAVLPTDLPGVHVAAPLDLMALRGSITTEVHCDRVRLGREWVLAGPAERVLEAGRGGAGGLETSCLALGLVTAAVDFLTREAEARPNLRPVAERMRGRLGRTWHELERLAEGANTPEEATALRGRANVLALQASQAALTAGKGTAFVRPHPAQRWARQAMFFLVWSCPWPAASATLDSLSGGPAACGWGSAE
jgi:alkylation response protein AidB-like acyl-CoA dehydrogenase